MSKIQKHTENHKIDDNCSLAFFAFYPPNVNIEGLNGSSIQSHEKHHNLPVDNVFHTTWKVAPEDLFNAIRSIPRHCNSERSASRPIRYVIIFLAHCGEGMYTWGEQEININDLLWCCESVRDVDAILLLGCKTALPSLISIGKNVLATCKDVIYNDCITFYQMFMEKYRSLKSCKYNTMNRVKHAMALSYNTGITNKNLHHYF